MEQSTKHIDYKLVGNTNTLKFSTSPYLLEHAHNPVHWHEWNDDVLEMARDQGKPLIISIGYAACHWCHVMEGESFMDEGVAKLMNENFVCIKVDREERPDIDQVYMEAVQIISGRGGWPLNAFALPDGQPFYAGTYFNRVQWKQVLQQIANLWENDREKLIDQAEKITSGINSMEPIATGNKDAIGKNDYLELFKKWPAYIDFVEGGYKRAPKFPLPSGWEFLLEYQYYTRNTEALESVELTLNKMAMGGINDQIGGGFARYSTDEKWFAPHFEKMLYDNGQLLSLYSNAFKVTKNSLYKEVALSIIDFVTRELRDETGGFYSSLNADSEKVEGKFYIWKKSEFEQVLGNDAELFAEYYNLTDEGNWEHGSNILFTNKLPEEFAIRKGLESKNFAEKLENAKRKLLASRSLRVRPSTDDKILASWNSIMLKGLVDAYTALGVEEHLNLALKNAEFITSEMMKQDGKLMRNFKGGKASIDGFLEDYANFADALVSLYQATFHRKWLDVADRLMNYCIENFWNPTTGFFYFTSSKSEKLIARKVEIQDNVIPASNSIMANMLFKLGHLLAKAEWVDLAARMLNSVKDKIADGGPYYSNWGRLHGLFANGLNEVAILGGDAEKMRKEISRNYLPNTILAGGNTEDLPILKSRLVEGETLIYICRNSTCGLPLRSSEEALKELLS